MTGWPRTTPALRRRLWRAARLLAGAAILALLVRRVGAAPFVDGVRRVTPAALASVLGLTAMTTVLSAWRWRLVAGFLGQPVALGRAVAAYYRSQFLNSTLPGGVLGDLHRGVRQGEATGDLARSLRGVAWDRAIGQVVQVVLATVTVLALASPVRPAVVTGLGPAAALVLVVALTLAAVRRAGAVWVGRVSGVVRADLRALLRARCGPAILGLSALVVVGHTAVFLVAARANGASASIRLLLPIALLVLLAMTLPTSVGGWGPREGVAAWAFSVAGLGAGQGVQTATTYGVLSLVATLPGAVVLFFDRRPQAWYDEGLPAPALVGSAAGGSHG